MNNKKIYLCGSTVRLVGEFFDFENNPTDITLPKVIIYDYRYNKVSEITLDNNNKLGVGIYFYDFVTDMVEKTLIYEFYGELNGSPALDRNSFTSKFID